MVKINGEMTENDGMTVAEYLEFSGYSPSRVAVEKNGEIVPREEYAAEILADGDSVEIVGFVGGG